MFEVSEVHAAARKLGLDVATMEIRRAEDIAPAFEALKGRADGLYVASDSLTSSNLNRIYTFALVARLPTIYGIRDRLERGGLMSYGPKPTELWRRPAPPAAKYWGGAQAPPIPLPDPRTIRLRNPLT